MYHCKVAGYDVIFPYEPYNIQKAYMGRLLDCLKNERNGLLESPTGTGKTLSILCAAMSWLDVQNETDALGESSKVELNDSAITPVRNEESLASRLDMAFNSRLKVIYSSRTHVQLAQAMKELKRTYYADRAAVILGSRDQLCIHSEVKKMSNNALKNQACRTKVSQHACSFYESYEQKASKAFDDNQVIDIEDLVTKGTSGGFCPYYASRLQKNKAQVIFTPYNYLLVPSLRRSQGIELDNSVIIFDEGHNIESICEESASTIIESAKLSMCISELNILLEKAKNEIQDLQGKMDDTFAYEAVKMVDEINSLGIENIINLKNVLCDLESEIDSQVAPMPKDNHKQLDSGWIVELVREKLCLKADHVEQISKTIDKIGSILTLSSSPSTASKVAAFESLSDFFKTLAPLVPISSDFEEITGKPVIDFEQEFRKKYRLCLSVEQDQEVFKRKVTKGWIVASKEEEATASWTLHIYCMSPSVAINQLIHSGAKSIIITSGTLAPMLSFEAEMEIPFPVKLENRHVIRENQLMVRVLSKALDGCELDSRFANRENKNYVKGLGDVIVDYSKIIPGGILVFFSSYSVMNKTIESWRLTGIWTSLSETKVPLIEPKDKYSFADAIAEFKSVIDGSRGDESKKGSIFFGVTRGKLSEGLDIANDYCRGVIIIGLPFASCFDKRSQLKKSYIESKRDHSFNYQTYYTLQMKRGLNQSIGRVIRHKDDYGVVLLCDHRFSGHKNSLSKWIQPFFSTAGDYSAVRREVKQFFKSQSSSEPVEMEMKELETEKVAESKFPKFRNPSKIAACSLSTEVKKQDDKDIVCQYSSSQHSLSRQLERVTKPHKFFEIFKKCEGKGDTRNSSPSKRCLTAGPSIDVTNNVDQPSCDEQVRKKLKVPLRSVVSKNDEGECRIEEAGGPPDKNPVDQELMKRFIEREGLQIRKIFEGTSKFAKLCQGLRRFNHERDLLFLMKLLEELFSDVKSPLRDKLLAGMCILVPSSSRAEFIEGLEISQDYVPKNVFSGDPSRALVT